MRLAFNRHKIIPSQPQHDNSTNSSKSLEQDFIYHPISRKQRERERERERGGGEENEWRLEGREGEKISFNESTCKLANTNCLLLKSTLISTITCMHITLCYNAVHSTLVL